MSTNLPLSAYTVHSIGDVPEWTSTTITTTDSDSITVGTPDSNTYTIVDEWAERLSRPMWRVVEAQETEDPYPLISFEEAKQETGIEDVPVPEDLEIITEAYAVPATREEMIVFMEIKGPTLLRELALNMPPAILQRLDLLIKQAFIQAFSLVPKEECRRTLIMEEEEDVGDSAEQSAR